MIKAIVFDMGGVLLLNRIEEILEKVAERLEIDLNVLRDLRKEHVRKLSTGKESMENFARLLKEKTGLEIGEDEIIKIWKSSYLEVMPVNEELVEIVKELKKKYVIGMISNLPDLHAEINIERNLFDLFEPCLLSCKVGFAKPDKEIFELMLQKLALKAEKCLFVDDRTQHLEAAKKLGFETIQFKNNKQLIEELKEKEIVM